MILFIKPFEEVEMMSDIELLENILNEVKGMKTEISGMKTEISGMKTEITSIKTLQQEDHLILKALEHSSEVNKAEHDKLNNDIAHIKGHLKNIDENIGAVKDIIGRHEVDITVLKRRPV